MSASHSLYFSHSVYKLDHVLLHECRYAHILLTNQIGSRNMTLSRILQRHCKSCNVKMCDLRLARRCFWRSISKEGQDGVVAMRLPPRRVIQLQPSDLKGACCAYLKSHPRTLDFISPEKYWMILAFLHQSSCHEYELNHSSRFS